MTEWQEPVLKRFWAKVHKTDTCWVWTAALCGGWKKPSYGSFTASGRRAVLAHRFAYELLVGPIPDGLQLDHLCRNTRCVNPDHLEPVTSRENTMRGIGNVAVVNAAKTHCLKGHPLSGGNLYRHPGGGRDCRKCRLEAGRRYYARKRKAAA